MSSTNPLSRRAVLALAASFALAAASSARAAGRPLVQVWKDAGCGCCRDWIEVLRSDGFEVEAHDSGNREAYRRLGLNPQYASCHTALVGGYAVIGHVPPKDMRRLLREKPAALGLSAPGMPVGSPGMDGPAYQGRHVPYDVVLMLADGSARIWSRYS